jgi:UDPglucose--hexose-1-phosphate uridylyltransferase
LLGPVRKDRQTEPLVPRHRAPRHRAPRHRAPLRRVDLFTGKHILIASSRESRPDDFQTSVAPREPELCPFCPGNESQTPPERLRFGQSEWLTRVFPNKYPAVFESQNGESNDPISHAAGAHEVIVESPRHVARYSELTEQEACGAFRVYAARLRHYRDAGYASGYLFKNCGRDAGASLEHVHSQLIALHRVPMPVRQRIERNRRFCSRWQRNISEFVIEREQRDLLRVVASDADVIAFAPFASRAPYELRILPLAKEPSIESLSDVRLDRLALLLSRLTAAAEAVVSNVPYNVILQTRPWRMRGGNGGFDRWQIEIVPRIARWAGYELGTDEYINPVLPEDAATRIKAHLM